MSESILSRVESLAHDGQLACADAHAIAQEMAVSPFEVGRVVNESTMLRFYRCQLGLFGYGPKSEGRHKIAQAAIHVPEEIAAELRDLARDGCVPCAQVWALADRHRYPRLGVANIIEALGLRVKPCQLGCF